MPEPVRLLYVSTLDRIVSVMLPHLDAARAQGWRVETACRLTVYGDELKDHTDAVHEIPLARFPLHPLNLVALFRLKRLMRENSYDIIHCHNPTGGFIGRWAATLAKTGALRVYTAHGFHFHRGGGRLSNFIYRTAERIAGHFWSDAVLVITQEDYEAAREGNIVPAERLFLTHGVGVSARDEFDPAQVTPEEAADLRREMAIPLDAQMITMVAELIPRKRPDDALAAFAAIYAEFPQAYLLLVGDGALFDELRRRAEQIGVADRTRIPGFRRDIRRILAASDVFLLTAGQEGLPCVVQEALAMGVPAVVTDIRGNADLVDASCGWLAPAGNVEALAQSLREALRCSPEARREKGKAGREKMLRLYDRAACVAEWQGIYARLREQKDNNQETLRIFEG